MNEIINVSLKKEEFEKILETEITPKLREVLFYILKNVPDKNIASSLGKRYGTVRKQISNIYQKFKLKEIEGSQRVALINMFTKYKPELINENLANTNNINIDSPDDISFSKLLFKKNIKTQLGLKLVSRPLLEEKTKENICNQFLTKIISPFKMGKTTLVEIVTQQIKNQRNDYLVLFLDFKLLLSDESINNSDIFYQTLCETISDELIQKTYLDVQEISEIKKALQDWNKNDIITAKYKFTHYFKTLLENERINNIVIVLDDVDIIFDKPELINDFHWLIRGWYDQSKSPKYASIWQKLHLVLNLSTYTLELNKSNLKDIGIEINVPPLNLEEITQLLNIYEITQINLAEKLQQLSGGNPYLVNQIINYLINESNVIDNLNETILRESPIYKSELSLHLEQIKRNLDKNNNIKKIFQIILKAEEINENILNIEEIKEQEQNICLYELTRIGLIKKEKNNWKPFCYLYAEYFKQAWKED